MELNPAFRDYEERTIKVEQVLRELRADNAFVTLKGWRDEVSYRIIRYTCAMFILLLAD